MTLCAHLTAIRPRIANSGFSLVELLVVVALLAILAGLAAPSFSGMFEKYRVSTSREAVLASVQLSRSEAIRQGTRVLIARKTACGLTLTVDNDWSCGWTSFADANGNNSKDAGEAMIQDIEPPTGVVVMKNGTVPLAYIAINRYGQAEALAQGFAIYPKGKLATDANAQRLCFGAGGRIRTIPGSTTC